MKCSNCHNISEKNVVCIICGDTFCSYICMEPHMILSHKKNMNILIDYNKNNQTSKNSKNYLLNLKNNQNNIKSPYLIPGVLKMERNNYDEKYNLDNFVPIFEEGKPKIIGCGSFGEVFLVMNTINKKLYAIKHMEKKSLSTKLNSLEGIYKEIYIQSRIDHPNILPILYVNETSSDFDLVLEYASGGSLFHYIRRKKYLSEPLAFSLFIQVINAIYFLHKNNFIHRDIKPENILLFDNNIIKLCDFGWCVRLEEGQQRATFCGTTEYMSPELVNHEEYSKEIDVWSLGVLLYEMVHGYSPFRPDKPNFKAKDVIENIRLHKLKFNKNVSQKCKELIYHLLDEDPNKRYKVEDIFYSDFVKFYEEKHYGLPDNYLIEKYKFKMAKAAYSKSKNNSTKSYINNYNIDNNFVNINKFIIRKNSEIIVNNFKKDKNLGLIYDKNNKRNKLYKKEIIPTSLSDANLKTNKMCEKKLTKNNTTQYFHPLKSSESKNNYLYFGLSKSKNNSNQKLITQFNSNEQKENEDNNYQKLISKNEKKIKAIANNNCFSNLNINKINLIKKNDEKNNINEQVEGNIVQKKQLHIKPLKMSKIPINTKMFHYAHSPMNRENTNYLLIKKYLSPKNIVNIKNNKITSFQSNKSIESKYIEVKRNKFLNTPINNNNYNDRQNKKLNKNNYSKKTYTRNHINNEHYNTAKINYNSDENNSNINTNNNSHNNDCFTFNAISNLNNDDLLLDRIKQRKLSCTKSLNHLKRNFNNDNIKSFFISNIKSNINILNNNSINSEKNYVSTKNKVYINKKPKCNLNIDANEKKTNTDKFHTFQNSPLNTFNNNFIYINFNNENKKLNNNIKKDNNLNICTYTNNNSCNINYSSNSKYRINSKELKLNNINYDNNLTEIPKKKFHKSNLSAKINNFEEYTKYKIIDKILNHNEKGKTNMNNLELSNENYYYDKSSRLLNSMSHNSIFNNNKNKKIRNQNKFIFHNNTEVDKKLKKIPKTKTFKKEQSLNINFNNKQKIEIYDKNKYNNKNINNYNQHKIFSLETEKIKNRNNLNYNRDRNHKADVYKSKTRNNSNSSNNSNDIKFKIIKRLELNDFLNNIKISKDKKNVITTSNELNFSTSGNQSDTVKMSRINTSINNKNCYEYFESNKNNPLEFKGNKSLRINNTKYSFGSRNFYIGDRNQNQYKIKSKNSNIIKQYSINEQKSNNLDNKIKLIIKKEPKTIISPINPKHKKEFNLFMKSENNINFQNIEHHHKNKLKNNIIGNKVYSNELFSDKNDNYKKDIYNGSSSVRHFKNNF